MQRLRALRLQHLRVDLDLTRLDSGAVLRQGREQARWLGVGLEIALFLSKAAVSELERLVDVIERMEPPVSRWLLCRVSGETTREEWAQLARRLLGPYDPQAEIGGGNNLNFTELNRQRPPAQALDLVCWSPNPQVHAFDNSSLVESLATQASTVRSARQFALDMPLAVSPVTLKSSSNPGALGPLIKPGVPPTDLDVRQMSPFGAV